VKKRNHISSSTLTHQKNKQIIADAFPQPTLPTYAYGYGISCIQFWLIHEKLLFPLRLNSLFQATNALCRANEDNNLLASGSNSRLKTTPNRIKSRNFVA